MVKARVIDSVHVDMLVGMEKGFLEEEIVPLDICGVSRVKVLQLITGFRDGQGLPGLVDGEVHDVELRESKDDVFLATVHDVEEMFLDNSFDVYIEGVGVMDCTRFVHSLIHISDCDRGGEFVCGKSVFPDKLPVDAGNISTRVY